MEKPEKCLNGHNCPTYPPQGTTAILNLDDLLDVEAPSPTDGQVLTWEGATGLWKNKSAPAAAAIVPATLVVAASDSKDPTRADYQCDGTADQAEINAAISALPTIGGKVVLLEGTYNLSNSILINRSNVTLEGAEYAKLLASATIYLIQITGAYSNIRIKNIILDGGLPTYYGKGIYSSGYKIDNLTVEGCTFQNCDGHVLTILGDPASYWERMQILNNRFIDNDTSYGTIYVSYGRRGVIRGNSIITTRANGYGIRVSACEETVISNNMIVVGGTTSSYYGVYLEANCFRSIIIGNTIRDAYWGIDSCGPDLLIAENTITNCNPYAIELTADSAENIVVNNHLKGNVGTIEDLSTAKNNVIRNNYGFNPGGKIGTRFETTAGTVG